MATRIDSLALLDTQVWQELQRAAAQPGHEWRTMVLATVEERNAEARCVVLREADEAARELVFYTDARSAKARQMRDNPRGTLLCWSQSLGWQLRLRVDLEIRTSGLKVSSRWARLKLTPAAQDYLSPLPPGSKLAAGREPERASRSHFAMVTARVRSTDWLELHADGHRRAHFDASGATWLQP